MGYEKEEEFIEEFSRAVLDVYRELLEKYEIEDDDAVITLATGVYIEGEDLNTSLLASMITTAVDTEELSSIIQTSLEVYMNVDSDKVDDGPEEGTIEWWLKHFGGDRSSELN